MKNFQDPLWFSQSLDVMASLTSEQRQELLELGEVRRYRKNQMIFQAGVLGKEVFLVLDGFVKIYHLAAVGKEVILWFCAAGDLFGLAELSGGKDRKVYAQSRGDTSVLAISLHTFKGFLLRHPTVGTRVIDLLSCRLRELGDVLLNMVTEDVNHRVQRLLTRLSVRYGKPVDAGIAVGLTLTHQEMADMIGTSRQTVSTVLGELRRQGRIGVERRAVVIRDDEWLGSIRHQLSFDGNSIFTYM